MSTDIKAIEKLNRDHGLNCEQAATGLIQAFLSGKSKNTLEAYRADLEGFREFVGATGIEAAARGLISLSGGDANHLALSYRTRLSEAKLQPATINRRMAALRSLVKLARTFGMVTWSIEIPNVKSKAYRDTRGPGLSSVERTLQLLEERNTPKAKRDRAIICLFATLALRISEVTAIDVKDLDLPGKRLAIMGKGKTEKEWLTLPDSTIDVLEVWLEIRGNEPGALFTNFVRSNPGAARITRNGLYRVIRRLGLDIGTTIRPHGLRHTSITEALKVAQENGIGLREVLQFSRHADLSTLQIYWDSSRDVQGQLAGLVAKKILA